MTPSTRADLARDLLLERVAQRAARDGERDRDGHVAAVDRDLADHVELGDRLAQLGVDDVRERGENGVLRRFHALGAYRRGDAQRELLGARSADARARLEVERDRPELGGPSTAWIANPRSRTSSCEAAKSTRRDGFRHDDRVGAPGGEVAERDRLRAHHPHAVGERRELREPVETSVGPGRLDRQELDLVLRAPR